MDELLRRNLGVKNMNSIYFCNEVILVLEKYGITEDKNLICDCYQKLDLARSKHFEYYKVVTNEEYSRCMQNLINKFVVKVENIQGNLDRIKQFASGNITLDDIDKQLSYDKKTYQQEDIQEEICILCSIGKITIIDNYKNCDHCMGIY